MDHTQEWRALGYTDGPASAEFLPPPSAEYLRAYHFTSAQHAVTAISLRRLKIARFSDANDPFELLALNCHDRRLRRRAARARDAYNRRTGMLCFTRDWSSPVLWSHYADRHRGICLGFNVRRTLVNPVDYADERLRADLPDDPDPAALEPTLQAQLARAKSHHWAYEHEVRVFTELRHAVKEHELYFRAFDDDLQLAEVILGTSCQLALSALRTFVARLAPDVVVFQARLAFRSFNVRLDGRSWPPLS